MPVSTKDPVLNSKNSTRIKELQSKIQDENYINSAIDRIAVVMSRHIVEGHSISGNTADYVAH